MIVLVHNEQTQKSLDVAKCGFDTNENEPCKVEELVPLAELAAGTAAGARGAPAGAALPSLRPWTRPRRVQAAAELARRRQRKNIARFRLYRHRSLQANTRFSVFFKIYKII